jgi:hypothetical protein
MRKFKVSAHVAPDVQPPDAAEIIGGFAFGAVNAAREYARERLPEFEVISARLECYARRLWRCEAVNHTAQTGAILWVCEL